MIVVAIIGVLSALAIYGVGKYLANAKTAEARMALGRISKDAQSSWERESMPGTVLTLGGSAAASRALCPNAAAVPTTAPANSKYQSQPSDWTQAGWKCLRFTMDGPQYFQYNYTATGTGVENDTFSAIAKGDLNGNTVTSDFRLIGKIQKDSTGELLLTLAPQITETNPEE